MVLLFKSLHSFLVADDETYDIAIVIVFYVMNKERLSHLLSCLVVEGLLLPLASFKLDVDVRSRVKLPSYRLLIPFVFRYKLTIS